MTLLIGKYGLFIFLLCFYGLLSVEINNVYEVVEQRDCGFVNVTLPCSFNYSTSAGMVNNPTTEWRIRDTGGVVGSINSSGSLNPGVDYIGRVRRLNTDKYDASIILTRNAANVSVFSCIVTIFGDTPATRTNYIALTATACSTDLKCPHLNTTMENGKIEIIRYNFGDIAQYSCTECYKLSGTTHRVCQGNGSWSGDEPRCDRDVDPCKCNKASPGGVGLVLLVIPLTLLLIDTFN